MKRALTIGGPCRYWLTPGQWQKGTFLGYVGKKAKVQPGRSDLEPMILRRRQVQPLQQRARQRTAVAGVLLALHKKSGEQTGAPPRDRAQLSPPALTVALEGGGPDKAAVVVGSGPPPGASLPQLRPVLRAVPRPRRPIVSKAYLKWIRTLSCCSCGAPPASYPHHLGRRGVSQKADDPRTVPLCYPCHILFWHETGTLPGISDPAAARLFLLEQQRIYLRRYLIEHGAEDGELQLLLARASVDALVSFFVIATRRAA